MCRYYKKQRVSLCGSVLSCLQRKYTPLKSFAKHWLFQLTTNIFVFNRVCAVFVDKAKAWCLTCQDRHVDIFNEVANTSKKFFGQLWAFRFSAPFASA